MMLRRVGLAAVCCLIALLGASGCAQMTVRVDILNSAYWASPQHIDALTVVGIAESIQKIRDGRFDASRRQLRRAVASEIQRLAALPQATVAKQQVGRLTENYGRSIDREFLKASGHFERAFGKVREATAAANAEARAHLLRDAGRFYGAGVGAIDNLKAELALEIGKDFAGIPEAQQQEASARIEQGVQHAVEGLTAGAELLDDPRASAAVYAPDTYWERRFNDTFCTGSLGNTDCAVKMEGIGSFTLKGVRLDATRITQATFSVAREAVQTVAAVYGVPVPKAASTTGTETTDTTTTTSAPDIQSPVKRQRDAATGLLQLRLARLAVLEAVMAQRAAVTGADQAARDQAITAIKTVVEANRAQLDPPAAP
jgi:uncharacterized protein YjbJ (UPF0337 family)